MPRVCVTFDLKLLAQRLHAEEGKPYNELAASRWVSRGHVYDHDSGREDIEPSGFQRTEDMAMFICDRREIHSFNTDEILHVYDLSRSERRRNRKRR